jgi:hypothetical protein
MIVQTKIVAETDEETVSSITVDGVDYGFILEDQHRDVKVMSDTRIPRGRYKLGLRTVGGHHARYKKRYPNIHKGMIQVLNVPGFEYILFHIGNTDEDTEGCLINGKTYIKTRGGRLIVQRSGDAYVPFYMKVAHAIANGEQVELLHGV